MRTGPLGPFNAISRLTLGGGGLGQGWGETSQAEAVATLREAVEAGINLIDTAPLYRFCETVIADAFEGAPPPGLRFTTKHQLGGPDPATVAARLRESLDASLAAMRLDHADIYFLHTNRCADDYVYIRGQDRRGQFATPWSTYVDQVVPTMEALKAEGRIGAWGITGIGVPAAIHDAIAHAPRPDVVQAITNLLDSAGGIRNFAEPAAPRPIIAAAKAAGCGVMGIRAVQAGALTLPKLLRAMSTRPAEMLGLDAGRLRVGAPADLIRFDPDAPFVLDPATLRSRCRYTPFDGARMEGVVKLTLVAGRIAHA